MLPTLRHLTRTMKALPMRPTSPMTPSTLSNSVLKLKSPQVQWLTNRQAQTKPLVNCACARHPIPQEAKEVKKEERPKDCEFDFRKLEVNPYDDPCDCKDPPPAANCGDVGRPREVCCRSTRQYGCMCEEEEEECEEEEEAEAEGVKTCDLDFKKLEVNPYDDPCDCKDPPPIDSCEALANRQDTCCRTTLPFTCHCEAYDEPGLECLKEKAAKQPRQKKQCDKSKPNAKCL